MRAAAASPGAEREDFLVLPADDHLFRAFTRRIFPLRIVIPTLNRPEELLVNFRKLLRDLGRISPDHEVQLVISENGSDPEKRIDRQRLLDVREQESACSRVSTVFIRRSHRLSLGEHVRWLGGIPGCQWMMWLGDDDLLTPSFLRFVLQHLDDPAVMGMIPGYVGITAAEYFTLGNEQETVSDAKIRNYTGEDLDPKIIHRGHQLSGLTYRSEIIRRGNQRLTPVNLYPWMTYQILALQQGRLVELEGRHARITDDTPKLFSYRRDGLLPEICEAIRGGFAGEYGRFLYYATGVIARVAYWRIFRTSRNNMVVLFNYLALFRDRRMHPVVQLCAFPFILSHAAHRILRNLIRGGVSD